MKFVIWWEIPCKGMMGVMKSMMQSTDHEVVAITGELSNSRKSMGWEDSGIINKNHFIISDLEWEKTSISLLYKYKDYYHLFNGYYYPKRIKKLINLSIQYDIKFSILAESPSNYYYGIKYILTYFYHNYFLKFYCKNIVVHSDYIFNLSGSNKSEEKKLLNIGWKKNQIIPFGYYTDNKNIIRSHLYSNNVVNFICSGNLEYHKGVDLLLKALKITSNSNTQFHCHITGKGPSLKSLIHLSNKLRLNKFVTFHKVLNEKDYCKLLNTIDVLIAPGRIEPWGIRINESIHRGNAIIVSDKVGASELILKSNGGIVFKSSSVKSLAKAIIFYLDDRDSLIKHKKNNLEFSANITPEIAANNLLKVFTPGFKK